MPDTIRAKVPITLREAIALHRTMLLAEKALREKYNAVKNDPTLGPIYKDYWFRAAQSLEVSLRMRRDAYNDELFQRRRRELAPIPDDRVDAALDGIWDEEL